MLLLRVEDLATYFHTRQGVVRAVDGISYSLDPGETLGIVGESGSGKSVSVYSLLRLIPQPPGKIERGTAHLGDTELIGCDARTMRAVRGGRIGMIFQDPMTALNPYMKIGAQVAEPLRIHRGASNSEARTAAAAALESVGIQDAANRLNDYPHQYSGGMRQRVMIAMAIINSPEVLIADEPTTALDVTVQAQILDVIKEKQAELGMAVILITHDLGIVANTCDRVLVMYAGRIVESARTEDLFANPRHPYTRALLKSLPAAAPPDQPLYTIPGMPPDLSQSTRGCSFAPRCEFATDVCKVEAPELVSCGDEHAHACLRGEELAS